MPLQTNKETRRGNFILDVDKQGWGVGREDACPKANPPPHPTIREQELS